MTLQMDWKWLSVPWFFCKHALSSAIAFGSIFGLQQVIRLLGPGVDHRLFGLVPIETFFDLMEFGTLSLYVGWGLYEANRVFKEASR